ncbi:MAG: TonB-dependent receptor [Sulfuricurvum sp.]|nr:TonB-dependent receptor [Sulfuricurvum sp.]
MKKLTLLSLAAVAALATESITIQKITVEASAPKADAKNVSADEMVKFSRQSDLGEMLSNTLPEITLVRNSGVGNDIILRGFRKDNINVTIDDAKVCGACPNRMDPPAMHVSSSQIASVEVQEGPFDVTQFGSLGGKINVVTKDPEKGVHGEISATLGSFDYRKLSTVLEGGNDTIQALVGFSRETSGQYKDGEGRTLTEQTNHLLPSTPLLYPQEYKSAYKDMDAYDRNNFWTKIVGKIGDNQKLTLSYFGDRADDVLYPRYKMDAQVDDTDMFNLKYQFLNLSDFSDELKIEGYHSKVTHVMGTDFRVGMAPMYAVTVAPVDATIKGASIENTLTVAGTKISVGVDGSVRNWNGIKYSKSNPSAINILIPDVDTTNIALYAKSLKTIGNYEISGGVRYDDTTIDPNQNLALADANTTVNKTFLTNMKDRDYTNISANLMAKYNYTSHTNVFMGAGQSIRVPDAKELYWVASGNTNLNETINREVDMGAEHTAGNFHVKGTIFYSDLKDFIYQYKNSATATTWANIDARIVGFDLQGDYLLNSEWRIESAMAYQKGTKKDTAQLDALSSVVQSDKDLAEIPPLKGRIALAFDNTIHYAMAEWIGARYQTIDADNGEKEISGYGIFNLKYGAELGNGFSLSTGINNFFNRTYAVNNGYIGNELITGNGVDPLVLNEPGRNFYATLAYKF